MCFLGFGSIFEIRFFRDLGVFYSGNVISLKGRGCICGVIYRIWVGILMSGRGSRGYRIRGSLAWGRGWGLVGRMEVYFCLYILCFFNGWKIVGCFISLEFGSFFVR